MNSKLRNSSYNCKVENFKTFFKTIEDTL